LQRSGTKDIEPHQAPQECKPLINFADGPCR
jgi:hypothetical protein